jgi:hypothetical protein
MIIKLVTLNGIHQTMFNIDTPRPIADQFAFERLGFADTLKRAANNIPNQLIHTF